MCTTRESLVGSGAWNKTFAEEMGRRPFYMITEVSAVRCGLVRVGWVGVLMRLIVHV